MSLQDTASASGSGPSHSFYWWVGVLTTLLALARPVWCAVSWLVQRIFLDPLNLRLRDLERGQQENAQSLNSLHTKVDDIAEAVQYLRASQHHARRASDDALLPPMDKAA